MDRTAKSCAIVVVLIVVVIATATQAQAQTGCRTANCTSAVPPAECQDRATPRTALIAMQGILFTSVFAPADPKLEPGMCVEWQPNDTTHTSTGSGNPTTCQDDTCPQNLCQSPDCEWDTGNVTELDPSVFCHYDAAAFPAGSAEEFCCRIHFAVGMTGTMRVTTPIVLTLDKTGADVNLSWTGGGVAGDETFKVERSDDKTFAAMLTRDPDGGVTGRMFRDVGEADPALPDRYYIVRNKQSNE